MKRGSHFQPPRQSVLYGYTRLMLDETASNAATFAMVVAEQYLQLVAPDVRCVPLRLGEGDALLGAMKNNAQILRRFMDGTVKALPADLEDAWVMALPEPYRSDCERDLARRRGRYSMALPEQLSAPDVACIAEVMKRTGELCAGWGMSLADGHLSVTEERQVIDDSDDVIAAVLALRRHMAAKRQQQGSAHD